MQPSLSTPFVARLLLHHNLSEDLGPPRLDLGLERVAVGPEDEVAVGEPARGAEPDELEQVGDDRDRVDRVGHRGERDQGHEGRGGEGDDGGLLLGGVPGRGDLGRGLGRERRDVVGRRQLEVVERRELELREVDLGEVDLGELDALEGAEASLLGGAAALGGGGLLEGADGEGRGAGGCVCASEVEEEGTVFFELEEKVCPRSKKTAALSLCVFLSSSLDSLTRETKEDVPTRRAGAAVLKAAELSNERVKK